MIVFSVEKYNDGNIDAGRSVDIHYWHEKGHLLYDEKYDITHHYKYEIERFCDDFMLLICGWKRTMTAQLWGLSEDAGLNSVYQRRRVLAQVGDHGKEFLKMVNDRIEMLEKRLSSMKCKTGMKYEVDAYWLMQLRKIKEEFNKQEGDKGRI